MAFSWEKVHQLALLEATRAHHQLGIDRSRRIDPFEALEVAGVVVMRQPLGNLAGIYLPAETMSNQPPGVLINVGHPLSKQRYTAAHELCHHRRDQQTALDLETEFVARGAAPSTDSERVAETFAAWFLMPKSLIQRVMGDRDLVGKSLEPEDAYELSLEFGTSYQATVRHLMDAHYITTKRRDELLLTPPQSIKRTLGASDVLADSRSDVWLVSSTTPQQSVAVMEGDAIVMEVLEAPSSGYLWQVAGASEGFALVREDYRGFEHVDAVGGQGSHRFIIRVDIAGRWDVRLELRRPWQHAVVPADERRVEIAATARPTSGIFNPRRLVTAGV